MLSVEAAKSTNFAWDRALNFESNSAPFINYAYTRSLGILKKLGSTRIPEKYDRLVEPQEQSLILTLAKFPDTFTASSEELNPTLLASYVNELSQRFHEFYEKSDIIHSANEELKFERAALAAAVRTVIETAAKLLGLRLAERM